jgi:predicted small lipoprotein YifL
MKKLIITALMLIGLSIGLTSCGSSEKCPAYSQIDKQIENPS